MTVEAAKDFLVRSITDKALVDRMSAAPYGAARLAIARDEGFSFTESEWEQATADLASADSVQAFLGQESEVQGFTDLTAAFLAVKTSGPPIPFYAPPPRA